MSGVFPSSSSLAAWTSAPCASASAIRGRLCRREDRWRRAPGWSSLGSSGSDGTSCSISTSPLEDSSDSSSAGRQVTVIWREKCQQGEEISRKCPVCSVSQDTLLYTCSSSVKESVVEISGFNNKNILKSISKNKTESPLHWTKVSVNFAHVCQATLYLIWHNCHKHKRNPKHTLFCDTVYNWTKNQDVCAAVSASSEATVTAQTCGAKHRQATDTLIITEHSNDTQWPLSLVPIN